MTTLRLTDLLAPPASGPGATALPAKSAGPRGDDQRARGFERALKTAQNPHDSKPKPPEQRSSFDARRDAKPERPRSDRSDRQDRADRPKDDDRSERPANRSNRTRSTDGRHEGGVDEQRSDTDPVDEQQTRSGPESDGAEDSTVTEDHSTASTAEPSADASQMIPMTEGIPISHSGASLETTDGDMTAEATAATDVLADGESTTEHAVKGLAGDDSTANALSANNSDNSNNALLVSTTTHDKLRAVAEGDGEAEAAVVEDRGAAVSTVDEIEPSAADRSAEGGDRDGYTADTGGDDPTSQNQESPNAEPELARSGISAAVATRPAAENAGPRAATGIEAIDRLGLQPTTTRADATQATTAAAATEATGDPEAGDAVWRQVRRALGAIRTNINGDQQFTVRLRPAELGAVMVQVNTGDTGMTVTLVTESAAAANQLSQQRHLLSGELERNGIDGATIDIGMDGGTPGGDAGDADESDSESGAGSSSQGGPATTGSGPITVPEPSHRTDGLIDVTL